MLKPSRLHLTALGVMLLGATPLAAQSQSQIEKRYTRDYDQCMDASGGVTVEMMNCSGAEIDRQDARLNQAYVMVMHALTPSGKDVLRQSERLWIRQRDTRCAHDASEDGDGTAGGLAYSSCILDETIKRIVFLEHYKG